MALPISPTTTVNLPVGNASVLAAVLDSCPTGVLVVEYDGRVVHANTTARDLLGLDANRLLVAYTTDYLKLGDHLRRLRRTSTAEPSGGTAPRLVQRVIRSDGHSMWIEFSFEALDDAISQRPLATVYLTDRTRQHLHERTIRAQVAGLDLALSQADVAVVVTDGATRVLRWSPGAAQLLGVTDEVAVGYPLAGLVRTSSSEIEALLALASAGQVVRNVALGETDASGTRRLNVSVALAATDEFAGQLRDGHDAARFAWVLLPADQASAGSALRASERRLRKILQNIDDTVTIIDEEGRTVSSSGQFAPEAILGYAPEMWAGGLNVFDLVHPEDQPSLGQALVDLLEHPGARTSGLFRVRTGDGGYIDAEGWAVNLLDDPDVAGILVTTRNVSERKRNEAFVTDQAEILRQIASAAPVDHTMRRLLDLVNSNVKGSTNALTHVPGAAAAMRSYATLPLSDATVEAIIAAAPSAGNEPIVVDDLDSLQDGAGLGVALRLAGCHAIVIVPLVAVGASANQPVGRGSLLCLLDEARTPSGREWEVLRSAADLAAIAIEREQTERHLAYQALHDELTGLANRHLLVDRLEQALNRAKRRGRRLALMFLDLDRFKNINDTLGHDVGDQLLAQLSERLRLLVRPEDTVARFGGDEFVVLVEHVIDEQDALQIADRLEGAMSEPFELSSQRLAVTASVGMVIGSGEDTPASLLRYADTAMYRAKELGRNRTEIYDGRLEAHLADRNQLSLDLRTALVDGHLHLVYQPVVDVTSGELVMIEALLRWDHPQHGRLLPVDFLAIAEDSGQALELGAWTLERGLADLAAFARDPAWVAAPGWPRPPRLSVKLSGRQLAHPDLVTRVTEALGRQRFEPGNLAIDVPERTVAVAGEQVLQNLRELHRLGISVALDDLGGAHSTALLGIIGRVPVDVLKVDPTVIAGLRGKDTTVGAASRGFQEGPPSGAAGHSMAAGLLGLGHGLGLKVVAQGVDRPSQLRQLRDMGYDLAQGSAIGFPVEADKLVDLLPALD